MKPAGYPSTLSVIIVAATLIGSPVPLLAQDASIGATPAAVAPPALDVEQTEAFLLNATIVKSRKIGKGVTGSLVATMTDGRVTHDAHIQHVEIGRASCRERM